LGAKQAKDRSIEVSRIIKRVGNDPRDVESEANLDDQSRRGGGTLVDTPQFHANAARPDEVIE
jgi:hypothetical protein